MIPRYSPPDMAALFSDAARFALWLEVELLATEAQAALGVVPADEAAACRAKAPTVDDVFVAEVFERENVTDHDVAAFVDVVQERIGAPAGSHIHYGLTSSDVVDTALCATLTRAADLLLTDLDAFVAALEGPGPRAAARAGHRPHPRHARRAHDVRGQVRAVGAAGRPRPEAPAGRPRRRRRGQAVGRRGHVLEHRPRGRGAGVRGARPDPGAGHPGDLPGPPRRVPLRLRGRSGSTVELMCTEIRHLARSELGEVEEPFGAGQKGSSSMPHKRNPILSERLCGLARLLRGYLGAGLEDVALWHERDISHSSVERVALPDASLLACYVLRKATGLAEGLVIHPDRALRNLTEGTLGLVFSQSVLLALVSAGLTRDEAYRIVQRDGRQAWSEQRHLRAVLEDDPEVTLDPAQLDAAFDLSRTLRHVDRFADALAPL